jgi:thiol-disulfide isomerase/thioredoxin
MRLVSTAVDRLKIVSAVTAITLVGGLGCARSEGADKSRTRAQSESARAGSTTAGSGSAGMTLKAGSGALPPTRLSQTPIRPDGVETITGSQLRNRIRRSGFKGTLVNAWASWCGPCKHEVPMLDALSANFAQLGVDVVLVTMDEPEDAEKATAFLSERKLGLGTFIAARPLDIFKFEMNPRWPGMIPAMFLYDSEGKLRYFWGGPAWEEEIVPIIDGFAAGKPIDGEANFTLSPGQVQR